MIVKTDGSLAALGLPLAHEDMPASREAECERRTDGGLSEYSCPEQQQVSSYGWSTATLHADNLWCPAGA